MWLSSCTRNTTSQGGHYDSSPATTVLGQLTPCKKTCYNSCWSTVNLHKVTYTAHTLHWWLLMKWAQ